MFPDAALATGGTDAVTASGAVLGGVVMLLQSSGASWRLPLSAFDDPLTPLAPFLPPVSRWTPAEEAEADAEATDVVFGSSDLPADPADADAPVGERASAAVAARAAGGELNSA